MKNISQKNFKQGSKILQKGGLISFPTETVFGFGVVYDNEKAYKRLIEVKRRPPAQPFTLMCADPIDIEKYAYVDERARKLIKAFFPGQFTIILKAKENLPSWVISKEGNVGIRVPNYPLVQDLIRGVGKPLLVPSANRHNEPPLTNSNDVELIFKDEIDAVIEGNSISNIPSTIVMINKDIKIIREGSIKKEDIMKTLEAKKWKSF